MIKTNPNNPRHLRICCCRCCDFILNLTNCCALGQSDLHTLIDESVSTIVRRGKMQLRGQRLSSRCYLSWGWFYLVAGFAECIHVNKSTTSLFITSHEERHSGTGAWRDLFCLVHILPLYSRVRPCP